MAEGCAWPGIEGFEQWQGKDNLGGQNSLCQKWRAARLLTDDKFGSPSGCSRSACAKSQIEWVRSRRGVERALGFGEAGAELLSAGPGPGVHEDWAGLSVTQGTAGSKGLTPPQVLLALTFHEGMVEGGPDGCCTCGVLHHCWWAPQSCSGGCWKTCPSYPLERRALW